jgi:Ca2+-binding RTX toxin-like protein
MTAQTFTFTNARDEIRIESEAQSIFNDTLRFLDGNDILVMRLNGDLAGATFVDMGRGDDVLLVSEPGSGIYVLGEGNDVMAMEFGGTTIGAPPEVYAGAGDDLLVTASFRALVDMGVGNDVVISAGKRNDLDGGDGVDTVSFQDAEVAGAMSLRLGQAFVSVGGPSGFDTLRNFENLVGSGFGDEIEGNDGANVLLGLGGNDVIDGLGGNDLIDAGAGGNQVFGGQGTDTLLLDGLRSQMTISVSGGAVTVTGRTATNEFYQTVATGVELFKVQNTTLTLAQLQNAATALAGGFNANPLPLTEQIVERNGTAGADTISGAGRNDILRGLGGNDTMRGFGGNDAMNGGDGDDVMNGGAGNDTLFGGAGADILVGGLGRDALNGGLGADVFKFFSIAETPAAAGSRDVIADFSVAQGDRIDLSVIDASLAAAGNQAFAFIGNTSLTGAGQVRFSLADAAGTANDRTYVLLNVDAAPGIDATIELVGLHALTAANFVL